MATELQALSNNSITVDSSMRTSKEVEFKQSPCQEIVSFYDAFMNPEEGERRRR
jgi:hypothetical protein